MNLCFLFLLIHTNYNIPNKNYYFLKSANSGQRNTSIFDLSLQQRCPTLSKYKTRLHKSIFITTETLKYLLISCICR